MKKAQPKAATPLAKPGARKAAGAFPQHLSAHHRRFLDRPVRQVRSQFKMGTSRRQHRLRMDPNLRPRNPDQKTDRNPLERKSKMSISRTPTAPPPPRTPPPAPHPVPRDPCPPLPPNLDARRLCHRLFARVQLSTTEQAIPRPLGW